MFMNTRNLRWVSIGMALVLLAAVPAQPLAYPNPAAVNLLTVENFQALAATTVTSPVGGTTLNGLDLGTNADCVDFPAPCDPPNVNGVLNGGAVHRADGTATTAQTDATAVVTDLNGRVADQNIVGGGLNGISLDSGVYNVTSMGGGLDDLTGTLTLNGDVDSIFIFRFNDTLITTGTATIAFTGGAQACNVYWTSASSITVDGAANLSGTFFAQASVDFTAGGAVIDGRVIAQTAAITFRNTTINTSACAVAPAGGGGGGGGVGTGGSSDVDDEENADAVAGLPDTGGAPIREDAALPWGLLAVGGASTLVLAAGALALRRRNKRQN
jgi:hypothetical protein